MQQIEEYVTKPMGELSYAEERSARVEQVIAPDGKPAVRVQIFQQNRHNGRLVYQPDKRPVVSDRLYRFPSARPAVALGRPIVGQWRDKELPFSLLRDASLLRPNADAATWMDYRAWVDAFDAVYAAS